MALESAPRFGRELTLDARLGVDNVNGVSSTGDGGTATASITPYGPDTVELERDLLDDRDGALDALLDGLCCVGGVRSSSGPSWRAGGAFGTGRNGELSHNDDSAALGTARRLRLSGFKSGCFFHLHFGV